MSHPEIEPEAMPVKSLYTSYRILNALKAKNGAGLTELADHLNIPKSTVNDHLKTLVELQWISREGNEYQIRIRFLDLGGYARRQTIVYQPAWPEVQKLALETGEHANLVVEDAGKAMYLYISEGEETVHLDTYTGMRVHLHSTALGKAILAHLPESRVNEIIEYHGLPSITSQTITDRDNLFQELETIRNQGYATDTAERIKGIRCIASPLLTQENDILGSISISGPANRMSGKQFEEEIPELVKRTANVVELNITHG